TPLTRLAPSIRVYVSPRATPPLPPPAVIRKRPATVAKTRRARTMLVNVLLGLVAALGVAAMSAPWLADRWPELGDRMRSQSPAAPRNSEAGRAEPTPPVEQQIAQAATRKHEDALAPAAPLMRSNADIPAAAKAVTPLPIAPARA